MYKPKPLQEQAFVQGHRNLGRDSPHPPEFISFYTIKSVGLFHDKINMYSLQQIQKEIGRVLTTHKQDDSFLAHFPPAFFPYEYIFGYSPVINVLRIQCFTLPFHVALQAFFYVIIPSLQMTPVGGIRGCYDYYHHHSLSNLIHGDGKRNILKATLAGGIRPRCAPPGLLPAAFKQAQLSPIKKRNSLACRLPLGALQAPSGVSALPVFPLLGLSLQFPGPVFDSASLPSYLSVPWYLSLRPQTKCIHLPLQTLYSILPTAQARNVLIPPEASLTHCPCQQAAIIVPTPLALPPRWALEVPCTWRLLATTLGGGFSSQ